MSSERPDSIVGNHGSASIEILELLREIQASNKDPSLIAKIKRCEDIVTGQEAFVEDMCSPASAFRQKVVKDTDTDPTASKRSFMLCGHVIGDFVKMVAEMVQAKRILEIGMFTGYSAVTFGESAFCEEVVSLDISKYMEEFVKKMIKGTLMEDKIRIILGPAIDSLVTLKEERKTFDLVFIDADKSGYLQYYKYIMDNGLLNPGAVILCDNIFWYNDTFLDKKSEGGQALSKFAQFVKNDKRVDQIIFPFRDGVLLIKPKVVL